MTVLALIAAPATLAVAKSAKSSDLVVRTDRGLVQGTVSYGVEGFLGIPYAAAPVGDLRWQPPEPAEKWKGVRSAAEFGSQCAQPAGLDSEFGSVAEDCLFINVQRPIGASAKAKLPVYVYIHGGGFTTGSGENMNKVVADTGVIGVSMNYRLGAAGNLSLPGLTAEQGESGNYGLLDQQAALKWVQRNIARFGGDPKKVTIGGESAGGWSVCYHLVAPGSRGLFSKAMIQSGGCPSRTQNAAETFGVGAANNLGCTDSDPAALVACMRGKSVEDLLTVSGEVVTITDGTFNAAGGAVRGTGFMPENPWTQLVAGKFAKVPVVVGSQLDEGRSFFQDRIGWTEEQYVDWVRNTWGDDADAVLAHYPWPETSDQNTAAYLTSDVYTDSGLLGATRDANGTFIQPGIGGCGAREIRDVLSRYTRTYAYEFAHRSGPGWNHVDGYVWGAGHATELNYLFPQHGINTEDEYHDFGPAEFALADQMVAYWGSFVKNGNPSVRNQPSWPAYQLKGHGWTKDHGWNKRRWNKGRGWTLSLRAGEDGKTQLITDAEFRAENQCEFWDSLSNYEG